MSAPAVRIRGLRKSFGSATVLHGIDLDIAEGEVTVVIGPSGSGKSTLLRCVNHLERPDSGFVEVDGEVIGYHPTGGRLRERSPRDVARQRSRIGMVFQQFNLFGHRTAAQNVAEGPISAGASRADATATATALLDRVGLTGKDDAYPRQLSGGQQQRVAIARALAQQPRLILFDEPTSALDPELVGEVLGVIRDLAAERMTMLIVTHELGFAREVADTVVFVDDGRIVESGPADAVLTSPVHERTRAFLSAVL
ncbi:amino acid ABC transporter ATP-binding protein [Gordonia humi]|uniref:Polar amino acid transport system ATP-binding protein n=1 Tax=Gordonia humi TaxID=686429 RepID=A0A840F2I9_9ACTN|nr:amino acid ABC transporter ATP-binding protein [Gordonia humi]MBB4136663.1 polar amino acid transport system ATP-binding protein [Gordonia humi]